MACRFTSPLRVAAGDIGDLPPIVAGGRVGRRLRCIAPLVVPSRRRSRGRGLPIVVRTATISLSGPFPRDRREAPAVAAGLAVAELTVMVQLR